MAVIADLVTRLSVNKAKFEADMKKAASFASGSAARASATFSAHWKRAFRNTGAGIIALGAAFRKLGRIAQRTMAITARMIRDFGTLSRFFLLGAGAGGLGIFGSFKFVNSMSEKAKNVIQFSDALGISTRTLQEWQIAGESVGFTGDKVVDVLKDASEKIGDLDITGGGELSEIVKKLKFDFEQLRDVAPDVALRRLFKAMEPLTRQQKTTVAEAISNDLVKMIPLLENGAAGFDKLVASAHQAGRIQSDEDLAKLNEYQRALRDLKNLWEAFKQKLAVELSGKFTNLVRDLAEYLKKLDIGALAKDAAKLIVSSISTFVMVATTLTQSILLAAQGIGIAAKAIMDYKDGFMQRWKNVTPHNWIRSADENLSQGLLNPFKQLPFLKGSKQEVQEKETSFLDQIAKAREELKLSTNTLIDFLGDLRKIFNRMDRPDPKPVLPSKLPSIMDEFGERTRQAAEALGTIGSKIKSFQKAMTDKLIDKILGGRLQGLSGADVERNRQHIEWAMKVRGQTREEAEKSSPYYQDMNPHLKDTPSFDKQAQKLFDKIGAIQGRKANEGDDKEISMAISDLRASAVKLGPAFTGVVDEIKKYAQEAGVIVAQKVQLEAEFYLEEGLIIKHLKTTGAREVVGSLQWSNIEKIAQTGG